MSIALATPAEIMIRPMKISDLPAVLQIQTHCYPPELIESEAALASRHALAPESCWVAAHRTVLGYLFSHPWQGEHAPALDTPLTALPQDADTLFIHDLALHPQGRGQGLAPKLIDAAFQTARRQGLRYSRLVAVQGASHFWSRHGYRTQDALKAGDYYGEGAKVMGRTLEAAT